MLESRQRSLGSSPTPDGAEQQRNSMSDFRNYQTRAVPVGHADASIDAGLRAYMIQVYNLMGLGLLITGLAAIGTVMLATTSDPAAAVATLPNGEMLTSFGYAVFASPLRWVVILAPLAAVFFLSFRVQSMSVSAAQTTFWVYAALVGLSLSSIFLVYTTASISQTFFATAAAFGALSLYGYTTRRDLTAMGSFLIMGVFGLIIAMVINIFLQSSALSFAVSAIGVLVFAGLTAYDTQKIKEMYYEGDDTLVAGRKAIMGAARLYLDFINMFMFLLQFMGDRRGGVGSPRWISTLQQGGPMGRPFLFLRFLLLSRKRPGTHNECALLFVGLWQPIFPALPRFMPMPSCTAPPAMNWTRPRKRRWPPVSRRFVPRASHISLRKRPA